MADDFVGTSEERWATPLLCSDFSGREVLVHLTASARLNGFQWFAGILCCQFDSDTRVAVRLAGTS